jgi:hypothetical protein
MAAGPSAAPSAGRRRGSRYRNGQCRRRCRTARSDGHRPGNQYRNGCRPDRRNHDRSGRRRCHRHGLSNRCHADRRRGGHRYCRDSRHHADRRHRKDGKADRRRSSSHDAERHTRTSARRLAGSQAQTSGIPRRRGRGRLRSAARHPGRRHRRHRAGTSRTAGQTVPGYIRYDLLHRGCHRHGSNRRQCFRRPDRMPHRSRGPSCHACRRQRRPGHATVHRRTHRRSRHGYPSSRHGSQRAPRRTHRGRRRSREIRQSPCRPRRNRRDSNSRRSSPRIDCSHPSPRGAPSRRSYDPRRRSGVRRSGVRARHRRRRAPARCRPQPLKPPPEHISLHPTRNKALTDPPQRPTLLAVIRLIAKARNDLGRKARYTQAILPPRKTLPRSFGLRSQCPLGKGACDASARSRDFGLHWADERIAMITKTFIVAKDPNRIGAPILRDHGNASGIRGLRPAVSGG